MDRALDSRSEGLGFDFQCWPCVEVLGKLRIPHCLGPPSRNGCLVYRSKVGSIDAGCIGAHLARGKVMSVEHALSWSLDSKQLPLPLPLQDVIWWTLFTSDIVFRRQRWMLHRMWPRESLYKVRQCTKKTIHTLFLLNMSGSQEINDTITSARLQSYLQFVFLMNEKKSFWHSSENKCRCMT